MCEARERARQKSQTFTSSLSHSHTHTGLEAELEVREAMERARPKSQTFTRQSELSNMLDGCSTHTHTRTHTHRTRCLTVSAYSRACETQALKEAVVGAMRGTRGLGVSLFFIFSCAAAAADAA